MRKLPNILIIKLDFIKPDFLFMFLLQIFFLKVPVAVPADKVSWLLAEIHVGGLGG